MGLLQNEKSQLKETPQYSAGQSKVNLGKPMWQEKKGSRDCSPQISRVHIFNIQIIK